jgi:ribosomal protein L29
LDSQVNEKKKQLLAIKLNHVVSGAQKPHEKKVLKKEIARMLTAKK